MLHYGVGLHTQASLSHSTVNQQFLSYPYKAFVIPSKWVIIVATFQNDLFQKFVTCQKVADQDF